MKAIIKLKNKKPVVLNNVKDIFQRTNLNNNKVKIFVQREECNMSSMIFDFDDLIGIILRR